jgi:hypothetical protein
MADQPRTTLPTQVVQVPPGTGYSLGGTGSVGT